MKKTIICTAMAAASAVVGGRPAFEGEFMCGVNFGGAAQMVSFE